jgi:hypothetical protein
VKHNKLEKSAADWLTGPWCILSGILIAATVWCVDTFSMNIRFYYIPIAMFLVAAGCFSIYAIESQIAKEEGAAGNPATPEPRPQFVVIRGHFQHAPHPEGSFELFFDWTNLGAHGMRNPRSIVILDSMDGSPFAQKNSAFEGVVHPNEPRHWRIDGIVMDSPNVSPLFILRYVKYEDAVTGKAYDDTICLKWRGLVDGIGSNVMEVPTPEEIKAVRNKHSGVFATLK